MRNQNININYSYNLDLTRNAGKSSFKLENKVFVLNCGLHSKTGKWVCLEKATMF